MRACVRAGASVVGIVSCKHALAVVVVVYLNLGHNQSDRESEEEEEEEKFDGCRSATTARIGRNIVVYIVNAMRHVPRVQF